MSFRHFLLFATILIVTLILPLKLAQAAPSDPEVAKQPALVWIDAETGKTLFTIDDIIRFDWDKQLFELKPNRATELIALPIIQRRDFAVKDHEGVIYRGRFYRTAAAGGEGYDGTTILIGQDAMKTLPAPPFFMISGGYQTGNAGAHERDRFSPRIHDPLEKAGLLTQISNVGLPYKRSWSGHSWIGGEQVLKASAILFEETFRSGQDAYLHLLLYKGQRPDFVFDKLVVEATCTSEDGTFVSKHSLLTIAPPLLDNGIYVCKFRPWEGLNVTPKSDENNKLASIKQAPTLRYPKDALNDNREGTVIVKLTVGDDGKVTDTEVVQASSHGDLNKCAVRSAKSFRFVPAMKDGQTVKSVVKIQFDFHAGKIEHVVLPPDPVKTVIKSGALDLSLTLTAMRKEGDQFVQAGSWSLPLRKVKLLSDSATTDK